MCKPEKPAYLTSMQMHIVEYIAALDAKLIAGEKHLEQWLRAADAWRDYRIAVKAAERAIDKLYDIVPESTLKHMVDVAEHCEIYIKPKGAVQSVTAQVVQNSDLIYLINAAMKDNCAMCVEDCIGVKKCKLRKALQNIAPPNKLMASGVCPYRDVAAQCELGEYI